MLQSLLYTRYAVLLHKPRRFLAQKIKTVVLFAMPGRPTFIHFASTEKNLTTIENIY
jgi:hypothetical protein